MKKFNLFLLVASLGFTVACGNAAHDAEAAAQATADSLAAVAKADSIAAHEAAAAAAAAAMDSTAMDSAAAVVEEAAHSAGH
ncbi:hypothetical protein GC167_01140 [bacterium]|nr:hypothetical protein [bacterium]